MEETCGKGQPRGIPNVSGVACHLSSALQLLLHAIPELRISLLQLEQCDEKWVQELVNLTKSIFKEEGSTIDPMPLYTALSQSTTTKSLDPNHLGDAATALRVLLHTLQKDEYLQPILNHCIMGARIQQTVVGNCGDKRRSKVKEQRMSCPFPVHARDATTLQQALERATIQPQPIVGLDWSQISNYSEQEGVNTNNGCNDDDEEWTTCKTIHFKPPLPQHLVLHLQRFQLQNDSVEVSKSSLGIPRVLDMTPYMMENCNETSECCRLYQFAGAILFVSDDNTDDESEEDGHYVTLIQYTNNCWYLLDDETVTHLPDEEQVLDFASGRPTSLVEGTCCATVVVYSKTCDCDNATTTALINDPKTKIQQRAATTAVDWSIPDDLIGRRLRIRWKSGKFYAGVVISYDNESGKHCINYDDGDVRHYALQKKTIEWINDE